MTSNELPVATILITVYNRKTYLIKAVQSVLNQTIDRRKYEIIVSKNFKDDDIDSFLDKNECINIFDPVGGIGNRLSNLISMSRSDILIFLEDDDLFNESKVEEIVRLFSNEKISYVNNNYYKVEKYGCLIPNKNRRNKNIIISNNNDLLKHLILLYQKKEYFGMSNISIRKQKFAPYIEFLKEVSVSPDLFFFLMLSKLDGEFLFIYRQLTMYRVHDSLSNIKGDYFHFKERRKAFWTQVKGDLEIYFRLFKYGGYETTISLIEMILFETSIHIALTSDSTDYRVHLGDIVNGGKIFLKTRNIFYSILFIVAFMSHLSPKLAKKLYYFFKVGSLQQWMDL